MIGALAAALKTSVDYLLNLTDDPRPLTWVRERGAMYGDSAATEARDEAVFRMWLEVTNPKLFRFYQELEELPEDLQERLWDRVNEDLRLLRDFHFLQMQVRRLQKRSGE